MSFPTFDGYANFAASLVATAPSPALSGTSLVVTAGTGANFPTPPFDAVVWPTGTQPTDAAAEIVRVTAVSTDTFTIVRGPNPSSVGDTGGVNRSIVIGDNVAANITLKALTDLQGAVHVGNSTNNSLTTSSTSANAAGGANLAFNIGANQSYQFVYILEAEMSNTQSTLGQVSIVGPVGTAIMWLYSGMTTRAGAPAALGAAFNALVTTSGTWLGVIATTNSSPIMINGVCFSGATTGTVGFQFAVQTAGNTMTVNKRSFVAWRTG